MGRGLLIIGGDSDPNIVQMVKRASRLGLPFYALLMGDTGYPRLNYNLQTDQLFLDDEPIDPAAVFIRQDVFRYITAKSEFERKRAYKWFYVFQGWLLAHDNVRSFNRAFFNRQGTNKLQNLIQAKQHGLAVPETYFTNDLPLINKSAAENAWIEKPVDGGDHAELLKPRETKSFNDKVITYPITMQQKLILPEIRIFKVGQELMAFDVSSSALDYRTVKDTQVKRVEVPDYLAENYLKFCNTLGLDYAAADFKTDEKTGKLLFMEVNSNPMFFGFDQAADGALVKLMLDYLMPTA